MSFFFSTIVQKTIPKKVDFLNLEKCLLNAFKAEFLKKFKKLKGGFKVEHVKE